MQQAAHFSQEWIEIRGAELYGAAKRVVGLRVRTVHLVATDNPTTQHR